jgi:2-(1,2-epoxy-1,2-dihydrophenyl)acetyl-CoA isomerase
MTERGFDVQRSGAVARCSLNCPEKMNALSRETGEPMVNAVRELMADETIAVIILRGEGDNFCTGSDLALLGV